jgi:hypothetical protein
MARPVGIVVGGGVEVEVVIIGICGDGHAVSRDKPRIRNTKALWRNIY